jgi:hypothetical protein
VGPSVSAVHARGRAPQGGALVFKADSAATEHVLDPALLPCPLKEVCSHFVECRELVKTAGGWEAMSGLADLHFMVRGVTGPVALRLDGVMLLPGSGEALISLPAVTEAGGTHGLNLPSPEIRLQGGVVLPLAYSERSWTLSARPHKAGAVERRDELSGAATGVPRAPTWDGRPAALVVTTQLWHERMGHICEADLQRLAAMEGTGVQLTGALGECSVCMTERATRQPHNPPALQGAVERGQVWHTDTATAYGCTGLGGATCTRVLVDEYSRRAVVY